MESVNLYIRLSSIIKFFHATGVWFVVVIALKILCWPRCGMINLAFSVEKKMREFLYFGSLILEIYFFYVYKWR